MASLVACKRKKDAPCLMIGNAKRFEDLSDLYTISMQNQANQLIWLF